MERKIVIDDCRLCPHVSHKGGFAKVAYIPTCTKKKCNGSSKEIPYNVAKGHGSMIVAVAKEKIPNWCPLPKNK